jgi:hypothetical protein
MRPASTRLLVAGLAALGLAGCAVREPATVFTDPSAPSQVTPSEALAIAKNYTDHTWRPFAQNILHGTDSAGIRVDTPDAGYRPADGRNGWWIPGEVNEGIPYKWGGFDDPATFDRKIAGGCAGGDVSSSAKRHADNAAVSAQAAGVDCSGFVSRCLKLPRPFDSSQLPTICEPLPGFQSLRPGDILNIRRRHVLLFAGWSRDRRTIYYYETGGIPQWKADLKESPLQAIAALGYEPLRYRGMASEAGPPGKDILTRSLRAAAVFVENPIIGDP